MKRHGFNSRKNRHPLYTAWSNMKTRCLNPNASNYKWYGERGIKICDEWVDCFENFKRDMQPNWEKGLQLDRIDPDGDYTPTNCRWVSPSENTKNRRCRALKQSKYAGVSWNKQRGKWTAQIHLGYFDSEEEAAKTYNKVSDYIKQ